MMKKNTETTLTTAEKPPILIVIFTSLFLFDGVLSVFSAIPSFVIGGILMGGLIGGLGIAKVITAIGLRKMRKWALYALTTLGVIGISLFFYLYLFSDQKDFTILGMALFEIVTLAYFWSISNKFDS